MSQPPHTSVLNGPENNVPLKDVLRPQDTMNTKQPNGSNQQVPLQPPQQGYAPRPPLTRLDSRSALPPRPGFPQQPNLPPRPQPPPLRQPGPGQQFLQRPPGGASRPPGQPPFFQQNQGRPIPPNFRPTSPLPRSPQPSQPRPIFQQRSVPGYQQRPLFEESLFRSQTLDSSDSLHKNDVKIEEKNVESKNEEERRRSVSSIGSVEGRSVMGSNENLEKKEDFPSRPESRASSRMDKIKEDEDKVEIQKNVEFKLPEPEIKSVNIEKFEDDTPKSIQNGVAGKSDFKKLDLKDLKKPKSPSRSEGDNDSGVDESTQGNDQSSNGDHSSPRKSSGKSMSRTSSTTPTKNRSLSRGSKSPSLKSPDSAASTPGTTEKKKVPMNKIQVGSAPSPNLKVVKSKIGSLENASYKPGGGNVKIESKKLDFKNTSARIEAKNDKYAPKGGEKKIQQQKLQWNAKSKIGSLENATHKPKGGEKKIETVKLDFKEKAKPKVGSKDNIKHVPGGGDVKIENKKLDLKAQSKVGSLDNVKHRPGGGEKKIFDDKEYLKQKSTISSENHSLSGSQNSLPSQPEAGGPVADENLNQER